MKKSKQLANRLQQFRAILAAVALVMLIGGAAVVHADQYDEQINALRTQNANNQGALNGLVAEAGSYQDAINQLQTQINGIQAALAANQAHQADLQNQINDAQAKLQLQRKYLGDDLKAMYVDGQLTTIEELATSKSLSEYVDKEEYRTAIQNKINIKIKEINTLQAQLKQQKADMDILVSTQQQQNAQLGAAKAQQQQMLAYNESQQGAYNNQIAANSSKIADLKRQQIAANARFTGGSYSPGTGPACGGGYPGVWCNAPQDSLIDSWGMYNRECVSYTAFRVSASGRNMPYWGGIGNANQWDDNAIAAGIPVDRNPQAGDVAISNSGYYGHAMYVESVNSNGTINISQYNAALDGRYSTNTISVGSLVFIHFP
jgi:surface antigen/peptidoglycan hydrolase CwlO-like protein